MLFRRKNPASPAAVNLELRLKREAFGTQFTLGTLTAGGTIFYTCEDAVRPEKIAGITAIPAGRYQVIINFSPRFQKPLPLLLDVPNFVGVRIHSGNTHEHTEGCILVGMARTHNGVARSREAMRLLQPIIEAGIKTGRVFLTIE